MKLKAIVTNQNREYEITTNTLKKYFENDLIDSTICFDEMKSNMTVAIWVEGNQVRVQSFERLGPNGYLDIIDPELRKIMLENEYKQYCNS